MTLQPPSPAAKDETALSSETLVNFLQTTRCTMLEDIHGQYLTSHADTNSIKDTKINTKVKAHHENTIRDAQHQTYISTMYLPIRLMKQMKTRDEKLALNNLTSHKHVNYSQVNGSLKSLMPFARLSNFSNRKLLPVSPES